MSSCLQNMLTKFRFFLVLKKDRSDSGHVHVRDDEDGHLIYVCGDVLQARCKFYLNLFKFY
jgi:hypothetical protein